MMRVTVVYEIEDDNLAEFISDTQKYTQNLKYKKLNENLSGYKKHKITKVQEKNIIEKIDNLLKDCIELNTAMIYKRLRSYFPIHQKSLSRILIKLAQLKKLNVRKVERIKGGFENRWSIHKELNKSELNLL